MAAATIVEGDEPRPVPLTALGLAGCGGGGDDTAAATTATHGGNSHGGAAVAAVDPGPVVAPRDPHTAFPATAAALDYARAHGRHAVASAADFFGGSRLS